MRRLAVATAAVFIPVALHAGSFSFSISIGDPCYDECCVCAEPVVVRQVWRWYTPPCGRGVWQCRSVFYDCRRRVHTYGPWHSRVEVTRYIGRPCGVPRKTIIRRIHRRYAPRCARTVTRHVRAGPRRVYRKSSYHTSVGVKRECRGRGGCSLSKRVVRKPDRPAVSRGRPARSHESSRPVLRKRGSNGRDGAIRLAGGAAGRRSSAGPSIHRATAMRPVRVAKRR